MRGYRPVHVLSVRSQFAGLVPRSVWDDSAMSLTPASRCNVLLSGGIDSALVAFLLCRDGWSVQAMWVDYGQPAAGAERAATGSLLS
jgi:tRNA(Ile)-lysidine synthase TilS/MesJ